MAETRPEVLLIGTPEDVIRVRKEVRNQALAAGFGLVDQTKLVTAASELARNTLICGGGGTVTIEPMRGAARTGVRLIFEDHGPGIADVAGALTDGYTSGSGLGLGLGGAKRLSNEFEIRSEVGRGTRVTIARWR